MKPTVRQQLEQVKQNIKAKATYVSAEQLAVMRRGKRKLHNKLKAIHARSQNIQSQQLTFKY